MKMFDYDLLRLQAQERLRFERTLTKHREAQRRLKHKIRMKWKGGR